MAYPSKIDRETITDAALGLVEREGADALTLRRLAKDLNVTANALYRYYDRLDVLVAATADAVARRLHDAIEDGMAEFTDSVSARDRVRQLLDLSARFAGENPALYGLFLSADQEAGASLPEPRYHELPWGQSIATVRPLVGEQDAPAATVTMWGMVHGIWALRQAGVLGGQEAERSGRLCVRRDHRRTGAGVMERGIGLAISDAYGGFENAIS